MGRPALKKGAIERSALELFVEKGIDGVSIRDIAQRAGVTEGALYRHHKSKNDLVRHLFFESYGHFATTIREVDELEMPFADGMRRMVQSLFKVYDEDPFAFQFVMIVRHWLLDEVRVDEKHGQRMILHMLERAMRNGEIPKQNLELTTQLLVGMIGQTAVGVQHKTVKGGLSTHAEAVARYCTLVAMTAA
ncbi:TetR/AcrR family transcriptional regulator [soil metagenome]